MVCAFSDSSQPFNGFQRAYIVYGSRLVLLVLGFYSIEMKRSPVTAPTIICNHVSWIDILAVIVALGDIPVFVSKKGVLDVPLVSFIARKSNAILVDSKMDACSASTTLPLSNSSTVAISHYQRFRPSLVPLVIFPEGTTSNGRGLMEFRSGAFLSGTPVQPLAISYDYTYTSPSWESIPMSVHLFDMFTQVYQSLSMTILPAIEPSSAETITFKLQCQSALANALHVPVVNGTVDDKLLLHQKIRAGKLSYVIDLPARHPPPLQ